MSKPTEPCVCPYCGEYICDCNCLDDGPEKECFKCGELLDDCICGMDDDSDDSDFDDSDY